METAQFAAVLGLVVNNFKFLLYLDMEIKINIDETKSYWKKPLDELSVSKGSLTPKDVAFGIGRKATDEEMKEYLDRCMNSELVDINM